MAMRCDRYFVEDLIAVRLELYLQLREVLELFFVEKHLMIFDFFSFRSVNEM